MGGTPRLALLSLDAAGATRRSRDVDALLDGLLALAADARVTLAGGNITRSPGPADRRRHGHRRVARRDAS